MRQNHVYHFIWGETFPRLIYSFKGKSGLWIKSSYHLSAVLETCEDSGQDCVYCIVLSWEHLLLNIGPLFDWVKATSHSVQLVIHTCRVNLYCLMRRKR